MGQRRPFRENHFNWELKDIKESHATVWKNIPGRGKKCKIQLLAPPPFCPWQNVSPAHPAPPLAVPWCMASAHRVPESFGCRIAVATRTNGNDSLFGSVLILFKARDSLVEQYSHFPSQTKLWILRNVHVLFSVFLSMLPEHVGTE